MRLFSLEAIKKTKNSIMVSFGKQKVNIMRAVLNGNWVNVLITDEATAINILN